MNRRGKAVLTARLRGLVRNLAHGIPRHLRAGLDLEDLISAGTIGLLEAAKRFDASHQVSFVTFAHRRIAGAMYDAIRAADPTPRSIRDQLKSLYEVMDRHQVRHHEKISLHEAGQRLGLTDHQMNRIVLQIPTVVSTEDRIIDAWEEDRTWGTLLVSQEPAPDHTIESKELWQAYHQAKATLDAHQAEICHLYYERGWTLKEIGRHLGLSESGICRQRQAFEPILQQALAPFKP